MSVERPILSRTPDSPSGATRLRDCPALQPNYLSTRDRGAGHILAALHRQLSLQELTWNPSLAPQLDAEIRGYKLKDDNIRQDTVLALAIALEHAAEAYRPGADGRIGKVIYW